MTRLCQNLINNYLLKISLRGESSHLFLLEGNTADDKNEEGGNEVSENKCQTSQRNLCGHEERVRGDDTHDSGLTASELAFPGKARAVLFFFFVMTVNEHQEAKTRLHGRQTLHTY
ncbi:hypothetical protein CEXT_51111 [Caerostris extrusa]|uniref:Uncharacterized protein n=1 Tax=Caerostris extrusa TaxID=172846 RepID=A0AAV4NXG7_CAEEX|nr:hypothetical protein CEXT_51111 [Caerostris extrusa]